MVYGLSTNSGRTLSVKPLWEVEEVDSENGCPARREMLLRLSQRSKQMEPLQVEFQKRPTNRNTPVRAVIAPSVVFRHAFDPNAEYPTPGRRPKVPKNELSILGTDPAIQSGYTRSLVHSTPKQPKKQTEKLVFTKDDVRFGQFVEKGGRIEDKRTDETKKQQTNTSDSRKRQQLLDMGEETFEKGPSQMAGRRRNKSNPGV